MDFIEQTQRERVIEVAKSYLGTPYHHAGRVKGAGVDCLTFLAEVFQDAGLVPKIEIPAYSPQWHLHHSTEKYLDGLLQYTRPIVKPQMADIVLFRFGRCFSHGAIVIEWPHIIHSWYSTGCVLDDAERNQQFAFIGEAAADHGKPRPKKFFSYWY